MGGEIFRARQVRFRFPPSFLYNGHRVSFPVFKRPGRGLDQPPPSKAEVKEKRELYLYSTLGHLGLFWGEFCLCTPYLYIPVQQLFLDCLSLIMEGLDSLETYVTVFQKTRNDVLQYLTLKESYRSPFGLLNSLLETRWIGSVIGLFLCNTYFASFRRFS